MTTRPLLVAFFVASGLVPHLLAAQTVVVRDPGSGRLGRIVQEALAKPHVVIAGDSGALTLPRDTTFAQSVVVVGRDVRVSSAVQGDLVAIGGDVFLRPGARIDGDVIAVGGAVYDSFLATVDGRRHSFRDETLVVTAEPGGTLVLDYRALRTREYAAFSLPGFFGVQIPSYDRVNGLSLPAGPSVQLDSGRIGIAPVVTYRSHLGKLDPSVLGTVALGQAGRMQLLAARTTRTNDAWIVGDLNNALNSIWSGRDTRNWYRADVIEGSVHRAYERPTSQFTPFVGARWERAWTTGIQDPPRHLAFSVLQRSDSIEGMARPNPAVDHGVVTSGLLGFEGEWESRLHELVLEATGQVEAAPRAPGDRRFTQLTLDGRITFPLLRRVMFRFDWHGVATAGDAPPQRYAWLGGSGTLKTLDLLSQGGDQLLFTESRAWRELETVRLPLVGSPTVMVRHMMGAAGIGRLPALTHNLGVRLTVSLLRAEYVFDPVNGDSDVSVGVSFSR